MRRGCTTGVWGGCEVCGEDVVLQVCGEGVRCVFVSLLMYLVTLLHVEYQEQALSIV